MNSSLTLTLSKPTKERLHRLIDEIPESRLPEEGRADLLAEIIHTLLTSDGELLDMLSQNPDIVRAYILNSPKWQQAIHEAWEEQISGVPAIPASEVFARLRKEQS